MSGDLDREREALRRAAPDRTREESSVGRALLHEGCFIIALSVALATVAAVAIAAYVFATR